MFAHQLGKNMYVFYTYAIRFGYGSTIGPASKAQNDNADSIGLGRGFSILFHFFETQREGTSERCGMFLLKHFATASTLSTMSTMSTVRAR